MLKALLTSFVYAFLFGTIIYLISPVAGFDQQETNLLYLFSAVIIFGGLIAPALEDHIELHNQRASEIIKKEHEELLFVSDQSSSESDNEPVDSSKSSK